MSAYYNEHDKFAAEWLRKLIAKNLIAPGEVDERDIQNVQPEALRGFTQCHFFAGIGVWSHALRAAGWADDSPVWTGSCPCQGFSASGKRGGFSDQRHLWPAWFRLIAECRPHTIFGEQVASKDGLAWLDVVSADMEGAGYAIGTADLCAAGFGAPHIRQRLYFVADSGREQHRGWRGLRETAGAESDPREEVRLRSSDDVTDGSAGSSMGYAESADRGISVQQRGPQQSGAESRGSGQAGDLGQPAGHGRGEWRPESARIEGRLDAAEPSRTNGFWKDAEWIWCRDNKYRPTKPSLFPLATGIANRVGMLRGAGNALNAEVAKGFIEAYMQVTEFPAQSTADEVTS